MVGWVFVFPEYVVYFSRKWNKMKMFSDDLPNQLGLKYVELLYCDWIKFRWCDAISLKSKSFNYIYFKFYIHQNNRLNIDSKRKNAPLYLHRFRLKNCNYFHSQITIYIYITIFDKAGIFFPCQKQVLLYKKQDYLIKQTLIHYKTNIITGLFNSFSVT